MTQAKTVKKLTLPNGLPLKWYRFPNQLDLMVIENHDDPTFVFQTWFKVGSLVEKMDQKLNRTGLAHLFEHMMFRGTAKFPDGEFDRMLSVHGGFNNATTWNDRTNYYEVMAKGNLERVMQLESDRFENLVVDEKLLETERGAVLGEYRMGRDSASTVAYEHLYSTAFKEHPYRFTVIGTEDEIKSFTVEDANYFYKKYYSPNCATIIVSGDVDESECLELAEKYYGAIESVEEIPKKTPPIEKPQEAERRVEFEHPQINETRLVFAYHTPELVHPDMPALLLFDAILTQGRGSKLYYRWMNANTWVSDVDSSLDQFEYPGLFGVDCDLQSGIDPKVILKDFDALIEEKITDADVERARNQLLLDLYETWEDLAETSNFIGESLASARDPLFGFSMIEKMKKTGLKELDSIKRKYFNPKNRTIVIGRKKS